MQVGRQQPARVRVACIAHDITHRARLDDLPGIHDGNAVTDFDSHADIVGHKDHAHAEVAL
jgi:hypothetical protein